MMSCMRPADHPLRLLCLKHRRPSAGQAGRGGQGGLSLVRRVKGMVRLVRGGASA